MKIDLIAGARPNFVKIAALIKANNLSGGKISFRLIHTGQHYDDNLSGSFFRQLELPDPDINLKCGSGTQAEQTAAIMTAYEKVLSESSPEVCIVVGDVNSSMACAISAKKAGIKVAHVEAGIRSFDWSMPEEVNRTIIDSISDYFFTTTRNAENRLILEGKDAANIHFVGNTMIDTLLAQRKNFLKPKIWEELHLTDQNFITVTLHRPANVDDVNLLKEYLKEIILNSRGLPVIFPAHPRTALKLFDLDLQNKNLNLVPPLSYLEFNYLVERSKVVITDSGGITEETTVLSVPCLTLRNNTERPETVEIGTNQLIGTDPGSIGPALHEIFKDNIKSGRIPKLWDGKAGERIINLLLRHAD